MQTSVLKALAVAMILLAASVIPPPACGAGRGVGAFRTALEKEGFTTALGFLAKVDLLSYCCTQDISCGGNNPGAPYMAFIVPPSPLQEEADPTQFAFRLSSSEAVVLVGRTPPPMDYFSYQSFLFTRYSEERRTREPLLAPAGDTASNAVLAKGPLGPEPFDEEIIYIVTADRETDRKIRRAASRAGYPPANIRTEILPSQIFRLGLEATADSFSTLLRLNLPRPGFEGAMKDFLGRLQPVLRVSPKKAPPRDTPFPAPTLRVRGTGKTEMDLLPAVEDLRRAILSTYSDFQALELPSRPWLQDGYDGLQSGISSWAATRDALYLVTDTFTLGPDEFLIIYGVNHEAAGKALYSSFAVYMESKLMGVATRTSREYGGSAGDYLRGHPRSDKLYAWKVARECRGETRCVEYRLDGYDCAPFNPDNPVAVGFRAYMEPKTMVGPVSTELVFDRVIKFSPKR